MKPIAVRLALALSLWGGVSAASEPPVLERVNQRWAGAVCRLRHPIPIKKKVDREGASRSPIWMLPEVRGEKKLHLVYTVSDRKALEGLLIAGEVPTGTELVSLGWTLSRPEAEEGLGLSLRFRDAPAELRMGFIPAFGSTDSFPLERLEQVERYARLEAFVCAPADERLVEVPPRGAPPPAGPTPTRAPLAPGPAAPAAPFELRLLAVAVRPPRVAAGATLELVLTYELSGGREGVVHDVVERRQVLRGERVLKTLEAPIARSGGLHSSAQSLRLPGDLEPGLYTLRASVAAGGRDATSSALFEVVAP